MANECRIIFSTSTATLPLFGRFCNVRGRRYVILTVFAIFMLGSGICGGATTEGMLIAGCAVQGAGSGCIIMVSSIIISDLVPRRHRGNLSAILMSIFGIGSSIGPFIGGAIVSSTTWRWIFYMNLPIGSAAFTVLFIFLRVCYKKEISFQQKLKRLLLGFLGPFISAALQAAEFSTKALMLPRFFRTTTSVILAINTFLYSGLLY